MVYIHISELRNYYIANLQAKADLDSLIYYGKAGKVKPEDPSLAGWIRYFKDTLSKGTYGIISKDCNTIYVPELK